MGPRKDYISRPAPFLSPRAKGPLVKLDPIQFNLTLTPITPITKNNFLFTYEPLAKV
jgi:hypothetical protein